jgi:hypothetical protein
VWYPLEVLISSETEMEQVVLWRELCALVEMIS